MIPPRSQNSSVPYIRFLVPYDNSGFHVNNVFIVHHGIKRCYNNFLCMPKPILHNANWHICAVLPQNVNTPRELRGAVPAPWVV